MAVPESTIWEIEPHTIAKHKILERYLKAWFPILNRYNEKLNYIDGFAGPGRYSKGEIGSPIIAIEVAQNHIRPIVGEANFVFIEEDKRRYEHLEKEISKLNLPSNYNVDPKNGKFHEVFGKELDDIESKGNLLAPTFAFIDPFGFTGLPFDLVKRLLKMPKVEVFITFMVNSINRFIENAPNTEEIVNLFGSGEVLEVLKKTTNREKDLRLFYQNQLFQNADFVRYFEMRDSNDLTIYYLFFATNNELGFVKMKEAMWKVDSDGLYKFSDATNPDQITIFKVDYSEKLFKELQHVFSKRTCEAGELKKYVDCKTPFIKKHLTSALKYAEKESLISVEKLKTNKEKRRPNTFPDDVIIKFN